MLGKILIISAFCSYSHEPVGGGKGTVMKVLPAEVRSISDSTPPLHMLELKDVDSLLPDFHTDTLTVKMKNGIIYQYDHPTWDYEDVHFSLSRQLKKAIDVMQKTFTKVEHPPAFPGGDARLFNYLNYVLETHKDDFEGESDVFIIQCIVHLHGEITDIEIEGISPRLGRLVKNALEKGPAWIPAIQNGRVVLSYARQKVTLSL